MLEDHLLLVLVLKDDRELVKTLDLAGQLDAAHQENRHKGSISFSRPNLPLATRRFIRTYHHTVHLAGTKRTAPASRAGTNPAVPWLPI